MMKKITAILAMLALTISTSMMPAYAATVALPEYDSHILTESERDTFFDISSFKTSFGDPQLCKAVSTLYDNLKAAGEDDIISAINYKSVESYSEASSKEYAEYFADFELSAAEDVAVILAGNYGSYGTIPVGIVNVKAGESVRVMDTAAYIMGSSGLKFTYEDIVLTVGDFSCAAIPLTPAVIEAFYPIMCDMSAEFASEYPEYSQAAYDTIVAYLHENANTLGTSEDYYIVDGNPGLNLGLSLYETTKDENGKLVETGDVYQVTTNFFVPYESKVLEGAEKDAFFHDEYKYGGEIVKDIYDELKNAEQDIVYAMNFKSVETYDEAVASPYAWYIADFELSASEDVSVLLVGNYGKWKTIPLGIFNLKADKPIRIMKTASDYGKDVGDEDIAGWTFNYKEIVELVKDFDCAAIPVSKEFLKAYNTAKGNSEYNEAALLAELVADSKTNPLGADSFVVADDVELSLVLKLYENDNTTPNRGETKYDETGKSWAVGTATTFSYVAPEEEYTAKIGDVTYETVEAAVDAANAGDVITVIADVNNEAVSVDKNITITGEVTLNNVSISAVSGCTELVVSDLAFTGNSWINSGAADKLTVTGVTADVTPSNSSATNSRSAFIALGRSEQKTLDLTVENSSIVSRGGSDPILGWASIVKADLVGNTFGSASAYQANSDSVKFMSIAQDAVITVKGNTVYSNYNGIVFGQNTTRDNAYTAIIEGNTFFGSADHIWVEVQGASTTHGKFVVATDNTVNGAPVAVSDIKTSVNTWTGYAGVGVEFDAEGKIIAGTFTAASTNLASYVADGYEAKANDDGSFTVAEVVVEESGLKDKMLLIHKMNLVDGKYPVHVYAGIDSLDYAEVGFKMTAKNTETGASGTQETSTRTVYQAMTITQPNGNKTLYEASRLDGAKYMFGHVLMFNPANGWSNANTEIEITPYAVNYDGQKVYGKTITVSDAAIKEKDPNSSLFKEDN